MTLINQTRYHFRQSRRNVNSYGLFSKHWSQFGFNSGKGFSYVTDKNKCQISLTPKYFSLFRTTCMFNYKTDTIRNTLTLKLDQILVSTRLILKM